MRFTISSKLGNRPHRPTIFAGTARLRVPDKVETALDATRPLALIGTIAAHVASAPIEFKWLGLEVPEIKACPANPHLSLLVGCAHAPDLRLACLRRAGFASGASRAKAVFFFLNNLS